jgi:hypothetical protein
MNQVLSLFLLLAAPAANPIPGPVHANKVMSKGMYVVGDCDTSYSNSHHSEVIERVMGITDTVMDMIVPSAIKATSRKESKIIISSASIRLARR